MLDTYSGHLGDPENLKKNYHFRLFFVTNVAKHRSEKFWPKRFEEQRYKV